jgi:hypothetical protein
MVQGKEAATSDHYMNDVPLIHSNYDVLFLKRLLFLKAQIDNPTDPQSVLDEGTPTP